MLSSRLGSVAAALAVMLTLGIYPSEPGSALGALIPQNRGIDPCSTRSGTAPHETFCDKYYACTQNVTRVKDCPNGLAYVGGHGRAGRGNQLFGNCEYDFNVDCSGRPTRIIAPSAVLGQKKGTDQINPCDVKGKIVGDVTYCDRYWECVGGQPELYDCPNGLAFAGRNRGVADGCDYPWRGNYCEGKQLANPPIGTDHCDWLYGIFGHETSCTRYWTCWNGTATEQLCIGGLLYNEDTHACDWPENVPGCQKHPLCKDDANGNVPLGKSCNRYWQCQGGYPRLQRCPAMLVFDKKSLRCVVPPTEDCDIPSTTPPPPEEEENQNEPQGQGQGSRPQQGQQQRRPQGGNRQVVQATQLREQQHRDRVDHRDNQYKERTDNREQQEKDRSDQQNRDRSESKRGQGPDPRERTEVRDRSEVRERSEKQSASQNVPIYIVQEANNGPAAAAQSSEEEQDFVGGNRQL